MDATAETTRLREPDPLFFAQELVKDGLDAVERILSRVSSSVVQLVPEVAHHLLDAGGKRIRPTLAMLVCRLAGGQIPDTVELAAATELFHNASLLHDDVVDQGNVRRGVPAARIVYGNAASVLVGDFLMARALELVVEHGSNRLLERLCATIVEMAEGEVLQLVRSGEATLSMDNYHRIISAKTAGLFSWCCAAGAESAGAPEDVVENAASLGRAFGMAFQVTDDILDYVSGPETSGKDLANDLQQGKMTLPLLVACELDSGLFPIVKKVCAEGPSESSCSLIVSRVLASGSIERCARMAQQHVERVGELLRCFPSCKEREAIQRLARQLLRRLS